VIENWLSEKKKERVNIEVPERGKKKGTNQYSGGECPTGFGNA